MNLVGIASRKTKLLSRYNVISWPTHERNQSLFSKVNADFWLLRLTFPNQYNIHIKDWDLRYAPLPKNHFLCNPVKGLNGLPGHIDPDVILGQHIAGQVQLGKQLAKQYGLPLIRLEHTLPVPSWPKDQLKYFKDNLSGDVNVFITEFSREAWGYSAEEAIVIGHALDTELFKPGDSERKNHILTVANDYINRDWCLNYSQYRKVTEGLTTFPVGDTPGLSKAAADVAELVQCYQSSRLFLNTAHVSPIPMALLEAASCGCACVSCPTAAIPDYFRHEHDILLAQNDKEMRQYLELLLNDKEYAAKLGANARQTIVEKCSLERFTEQWDNALISTVR